MSNVPGEPPQLSPDGRFYWDGNSWKPYPTGPTGGPMVTAAMGQLGPRKNAGGYVFASLILTGCGTMFAVRCGRGLFLFLLQTMISVPLFGMLYGVLGLQPVLTGSGGQLTINSNGGE